MKCSRVPPPIEAHSTAFDYIPKQSNVVPLTTGTKGASSVRDINDNLQDLLKKTGEVLLSNSIYKTALASNINAFHQSILMDRELTAMEARLRLHEQQLKTVIKRIDDHPPDTIMREDDRFGQLERKIADLEKECDTLKKALAAEPEEDGSCPRPPLNTTPDAPTSPDPGTSR